MKPILTEQERIQLDRRMAETEKRTGAQVVLAAVRRSDSYAELPWKAFALGAAVAGLGTVLVGLPADGWRSGLAVLVAVVATLGAGAACALLCVVVPGFARLFLDAHRAEVEVHQYAQSLFLSHEVFATHKRTGVLLLVSMFEKRVVLLPDSGLALRLSGKSLNDIVDSVTTLLSSGQVERALERGLQGLEESLAASATGTPAENELPDTIVEEKGP